MKEKEKQETNKAQRDLGNMALLGYPDCKIKINRRFHPVELI